MGAAAILSINGVLRQASQHYLGSEEHHTVYEAELVGLILAATLIQHTNFSEEVTIATDNQAAIKAITNFRSTPGQQLIDSFIAQMTELANRRIGVPFKIYWIPGHKGIPGNEEVDKLAKQAAKRLLNPSPNLRIILNSSLPSSYSARKMIQDKQCRKVLNTFFRKSPRQKINRRPHATPIEYLNPVTHGPCAA